MKGIRFILLTVLFCLFICSGKCFLENDGWINIELHHALDDNGSKFSHRGNVTIASLSSGLSDINQEPLSDDQRKTLKDLAQRDEFYRLKATVTFPSGIKQDFLTSSSACSLLSAQLNDVLWISIDATGYVTAITQTTSSIGSPNCLSTEEHSYGFEDFNTDILIRHIELAPVPDTASFIQKIEREREAREKGEVRDNRGFFAKYWMYIVPVLLLVFISGATNQDAAK